MHRLLLRPIASLESQAMLSGCPPLQQRYQMSATALLHPEPPPQPSYLSI